MREAGTFSRRAVLRGGAVAAVASAVPMSLPGLAAAAPRVALKRSTFEPLVGRTFEMAGDGVVHRAILAEVNDVLPASARGDENRFSLVFHAARNARVGEGIKQFRHRELGTVSLFAAPIDRGVKARRLEAVINRP